MDTSVPKQGRGRARRGRGPMAPSEFPSSSRAGVEFAPDASVNAYEPNRDRVSPVLSSGPGPTVGDYSELSDVSISTPSVMGSGSDDDNRSVLSSVRSGDEHPDTAIVPSSNLPSSSRAAQAVEFAPDEEILPGRGSPQLSIGPGSTVGDESELSSLESSFSSESGFGSDDHCSSISSVRSGDEHPDTSMMPAPVLSGWDVDFDPTALEATARVFPPESIFVGPEDRGPIDVDNKGDWTRGLKGRHVLVPEHLLDWIVFCPTNEARGVPAFIQNLKRMGQELGVQVSPPREIIEYNVARFDERVLKDARLAHGDSVNFVFVILPNNQLRRYADVKKFCGVTWGVASQCFLARNMSAKTLNSICTKVMIQVTAKLGGIPWSIKVPLKKLMVLGFDVYHCSARKGESAGGLVATSSPSLTSYISVVSFHKDKSELSSNMCKDMSTCLLEYLRNNGFLPDRIIMYRDGVGDGQVSYVLEHEVEQVKLVIRDTYSSQEVEAPKLTFIIVTKKINSRAFLKGPRNYENLNVGTVMDSTLTLPERYAFFLVSQDVRQGAVRPTYYNVVHDESRMDADKMQRLTYKMCHLYFNWSGTAAVPAPCQYAHKLAYLTGVAVNDKVQERLYSKLWYL